MQPKVLQRIEELLKQVEAEKNVRILYACESGSRAWGIESPNSDYDIRFIYVHELSEYLSIIDRKDTIELMTEDDMDLVGWDIKKMLRLMLRSNASPLEWIRSPHVYRKDASFYEDWLKLAPQYIIPKVLIHHYLGLTKQSLKRGISEDDQSIGIKTYFYVLRPLLSAMWLVDKNEVPPIVFTELCALIQSNKELMHAIHDLHQRKMRALEKERTPLIPIVQDFIEKEYARCREHCDTLGTMYHTHYPLSYFFQRILKVE